MRRIITLFLTLAVLLSVTVGAGAVAVGDGAERDLEGKLIILHSNDVHGAIDGYAKLVALKTEYVSRGAEVILADAGDYSQGTVAVSCNKGANAITMMNAAGYDVATIGNHEFDYGYAQLVSNMSNAEFKVICANVFDESGKTIFYAHTIIEKGGVKVGFIGVETPETQSTANPALIKGLTFLSGEALYERIGNEVSALKAEGADIIVCLTHLGVDDGSAPNRSYDLYNNTEGVDIVIDAHSHTVMTEGENGEPIQSTGTAFANIGVVVIDQADKKIVEHKNVSTADITADSTVAAAVKTINDAVDAEYGEIFAKSDVDLNGARDPGNRTEETNLGDLITDAMLWYAAKDAASLSVDADHVVALTNGGGIRASISCGNITKKDINTVLPFGNTVAVVYVTGEMLLQALEASTYCSPVAVGAFPQVSGMKIIIDTTKDYDANDEPYPGSTYYGPKSINRVTIASVNGKSFDPEATYAVVTNEFLAAGGDTYYAFASSDGGYDTGITLDDVVIEYINTVLGGVVGSEYAEPHGNITVIDADDNEIASPDTGDSGIVMTAAVSLLVLGVSVALARKKRIYDAE